MFFLNVPIVLIAGVVAARIVRPEDDRGTGRLDRAGTVLGALVLATATFAVIQTGQAGLDVPVIAAIVVAVLSLVGYLRVERTVADPMLPLGLFRRPAFSTANGVAGVMNLGTLGLLFLLTLFLKDLQHRSALGAGVAVLPLFLPLAVLAPLAGRVTARIGPKPPMLAGLLLAGVGLLATWTPSTPYLQLLPGTVLGHRTGHPDPRRRRRGHRRRPTRTVRPRLGRQQHRPPGRRGDRRLRRHRRATRQGRRLPHRPARHRPGHHRPVRARRRRHRRGHSHSHRSGGPPTMTLRNQPGHRTAAAPTRGQPGLTYNCPPARPS